MSKTIKKWTYGLISTAISSMATSLSTFVIAPKEFNFEAGLKNILIIAGISAFISIANYMQKSPWETK
jgi:hypothetical protein